MWQDTDTPACLHHNRRGDGRAREGRGRLRPNAPGRRSAPVGRPPPHPPDVNPHYMYVYVARRRRAARVLLAPPAGRSRCLPSVVSAVLGTLNSGDSNAPLRPAVAAAARRSLTASIARLEPPRRAASLIVRRTGVGSESRAAPQQRSAHACAPLHRGASDGRVARATGRPWPCDAEVVETIQVLIQTYDVRDRRSHFLPIAQDPNTFRDAQRLYRLLDALCVPFAFFGNANASRLAG